MRGIALHLSQQTPLSGHAGVGAGAQSFPLLNQASAV